MWCAAFLIKKNPSTILSQTAAGQAEPKKVRIFSTKSCFLIVKAAWSEMLQLHFQGVWTVNGKNTQRQISSHVMSRAPRQAKHRDRRKKGFRLRLRWHIWGSRLEKLPQPASPLTLKQAVLPSVLEKDKQAPAFCCPTPVVTCCICWSRVLNLVPLQI